jgi:tetratricopeptide (TPR) repeat protein/TolB-like protein
VCKIFEIHTTPTSKGPVDFVVMEFLEGETLAQRLSRGRVNPEEAQDIAAQLCNGVAEAHRKQVVHGDLKTANVILSKSSAGGVRAVITDFGLARSASVDQPGMQAGPIAGTPNYMAPELLRGGKATISSDLYALGAILYELACGHGPFEPDRPVITPASRIRSTVTAPSSKPFNPDAVIAERMARRPPDLKHRWNRALQRCLDLDPEKRFAGADDLAKALAPPSIRRMIAGGAVAAALAVAVWGGSSIGQPPRQSIRLAFLPFSTDTETARFGPGIAADTADRLTKVKSGKVRFTVIQPGDAAANKVTQADKALRALGATHVLQCELRMQNGRVVIHASVVDTQSQVPLKELPIDYAPGELRNAPVALAGFITGALHLPPLAITAAVNPSAYADWSQGVALARGDPKNIDQALTLLQRAVEKDPESPLTHARFAEAQVLKYRETPDPRWLGGALRSAQEAQRRNPDLPDVLLASAMVDQYAKRSARAESEILRALDIEPNNGDLLRRLGMIFKTAGKFNEALAQFKKAADVQPGYFKNYQEACALQIEQANYDDAVQLCKEMVRIAPEMSDSHYALGMAYLQSGRFPEAESEERLAVSLQETPKAVGMLANVLLWQQRYAEAITYYRRVIQLGLGREPYVWYLNMGTAYRLAHWPAEAQQSYRRARSSVEEAIGMDPSNAVVQSYLAYLCARLGEGDRAELEAARAAGMAPDSVNVRWGLVLTYEALEKREFTLSTIQHGPGDMLRRLNRFPDVESLRKDPRFQQLLASYQ